jgi:predicted transcriptional regulator
MAIDTMVLEDLGLTTAQIKAYLALLELGETSTGPLIRKTKLQNSVVYNALNQLLEKGLVTFVLKGKRRLFTATDPKNLIRYLEDKKEQLEKLVPQLIAKQIGARPKQEAQVFLDWKGVYNAFNAILDALPKGSDYIAFGAGIEEQYSEEAKKFFREWQKKRALMKYKIRIIFNEAARKQMEEYGFYPEFGKPNYRFVPGFAPLGVIIFGDNIMNVAFEETPVAVILRSKQLAESYKRAFNAMWKVAKP